MKLDHHILAVVEPEIRPLDIKLADLGEQEGQDRQTKSLASLEPLIKIGAYDFKALEVEFCKLTLSGKIPYFEAIVTDTKKLFDSEFYPRDGDSVTVFFNSKNNDTFKSIHMDFELYEVNMPKETQFDAPKISIKGRAKIPNIQAEVCRHYDAGKSVEHLELIARDLKLGFATNIIDTDDTQARIQAYENYISFIDEIVSSSYVSKDSFTTWYIDQFYYLAFVDINRIFDSENPPTGELQKNFASLQASIAEQAQDAEDADNLEVPLMLSNESNFRSTNMYIAEYSIQNNSARVSARNGYSRKISFYDDNGDKGARFSEFKIEPFVSKSMLDSDRPLRGMVGEKKDRNESEVKHKWMGRQNAGEDGLGNVHPRALYSKLVDHQNQEELQKMKLIVRLESFNPSLYKYQKIPLMIYDIDPNSTKIRAELKETAKEIGTLNDNLTIKGSEDQVAAEESPNQVQNHFLSGYYVIENIDYTYDNNTNKMVQELTLIRREWPAKAIDLHDPETPKSNTSTPSAAPAPAPESTPPPPTPTDPVAPEPIDAVMGEWSEFGPCEAGQQKRTREVLEPAQNGGATGELEETQECTVKGITYEIEDLGFETRIIVYNENDTVIFTGQPSLTATEAVLVQEAKNSLDSLGQNQDIQNMTKK